MNDSVWRQPSVRNTIIHSMCVLYCTWLSMCYRTNLVNGMLYSTYTCSPAHSHILIAVTPHRVKACLHILALTRTLLSLRSCHLKPLSHSHVLSIIFLSLAVVSLSPSLPSLPPAGWWWCTWLLWFFPPLLSQQIKRAGGADGCWQGVSASSAETCNCVPGRETLVFVFLTCNTTVTTGFYRVPFI